MKRQPLIVAGVLLAALVAVFGLTHIGWRGFSLDHNLNAVDLATLAVNIFIAYFLQYYFFSRAGDNRSEKDILIDSLRSVLDSLRLCRDALMSCHDAGKISAANSKSIKLILRSAANGMESAETAIGMSQCSSLTAGCKDIKNALFDYKAASTGGSFPTRPYDAQDFSHQEQTYRALSQKLHKLVFDVNQYR